MTKQPLPWLPTSCLASKRAAGPFGQIVDVWAAEWFPADGWHVLGAWDKVSQSPASDWIMLRDTAKLRLRGKPKALQALALAVFGEKDRPKYTDHDLRLMRRIGTRALDDLQARLEQILRRSPASPSPYSEAVSRGADEVYSLLIGVFGGAQLTVECAATDLVQIVRGTYPAQRVKPQLEARASALDGQTICVGAHLGTVTFALDQLYALEPGDLLVLDRVATEPVNLIIDGRPTDVSFALCEMEGHVSLELEVS